MPRRSASKPTKDDQPSRRRYPTRIIVKFDDPVRIPHEIAAERAFTGEIRAAWESMSKSFPQITLRPLYQGEDLTNIERLIDSASKNDPEYRPRNFKNYFVVQLPVAFDGSALARMLSVLPGVEEAYVETGPVDPPVSANDDPDYLLQGYLLAAPHGIDATYAWTHPGGDGFGVLFVDMERGWTLNHEDLSAAGISVISGVNQDFFGHGTAVLGEVVGRDNKLGGIGIAPRARAQVVSQWRSPGDKNTAAAILSGAAAMSRGDVLLLEAQTHANGLSKLPVEVERATFDAIRLAVSAGIVVIEAAGNGGNNLDAYEDDGHMILKPTDPNFRDSGALMVGAATAAVPHKRSSFSNFGARIDCYGWGNSIHTTGGDGSARATDAYTDSFGGTSGASAMLAGVAVLVQSLSRYYRGQRYTPSGLRTLLSDPRLGTPSTDAAAFPIGVMPDLRKIIDGVLNIPPQYRPLDIYRALILIVFGIKNDAGGIGIGPNGGPIPVGPLDPIFDRLSPEKVDLLAGLALTEMAAIIDSDVSRLQVQQAGMAVMQKALKDIQKRL